MEDKNLKITVLQNYKSASYQMHIKVIISSFSVYFIKLSTTIFCTHTYINITPHLPLKVVMSLIIVFIGFIYRVKDLNNMKHVLLKPEPGSLLYF